MIDDTALRTVLTEHIPTQRWFGDRDRAFLGVTRADQEVLSGAWPALVWVGATAEFADGGAVLYHVPLGLRPVDAGDSSAAPPSLGMVDTSWGPAQACDATADPALAPLLLTMAAPGQQAERMRPMGGEQSNTSVVFDERVVLKLYRRPAAGPNPDAEVTAALAAGGFAHVAPVLGRWEKDGTDRAIVQPFLRDGADGWALAVDAAGSGDPGSFAADAGRLGAITGGLHLALAEAFGRTPGDPDAWAAQVSSQLDRTGGAHVDRAAVEAAVRRAGDLPETGAAIRVHGDYHLGQALHTADGWFVLDFEGEPARPLSERRAPSSPLKDVAGMLRSFDYASRVAHRDGALAEARAWEQCTREAFLREYIEVVDGEGLVPAAGAFDSLLTLFELDKAIYEVAYEAAHRPDWVDIPADAVRRLLETT